MTIKTIQPSEYYDQDHGGQIPVFRPTMEEFKDFYAFMEAIDSYGKEAGIVKVIPPKEWTRKLPPIDKKLEHVRVRNPIIQHIMGCQGIYQQTNVEKRRPYTLNQWHSLCQEDDHKPPDLTTDRASRPISLNKKRRRSQHSDHIRQKQQQQQQQNDSKIRSSHPPPFTNTRSKTKGSTTITHLHSPPPSPDLSKRTKREIQADEIALAQSDEPMPVTFDVHGHNEDIYTDDYCKELERVYWRNLTFTQPMYGADMTGTLFDSTVKSWNVNKLDNVLNQIGVTLPGVNTPYLYFGMWKATFPWHVEDMDLYSINYLHFGAPKQWYSIPGSHSKKFESVMQTTFFQQSKICPEFLRHKTHIASPKFLANNGIPVYRCVQHEGEFMITFPFGYHSGYNLGFNCAESVNFALSSWLEIGRQAKACTCINDSVTIDMTIFDSTKSASPSKEDNNESVSTTISSSSPPPTMIPPLPSSKKQRKTPTSVSLRLTQDKSCVLCPSQYPAEMETTEGRRVHQLCAEYIPDTYLEKLPNGKWIVHGIKNIPPARWKLSCLYCHVNKGACIQCCFGKCCRSFHVSCAKESGATMEHKLASDQSSVAYDAYCPLHDPKLKEKKQLEKEQYIKTMTATLYIGRPVYAKWRGGGLYKGLVEDHVVQRKSSRIKFEDGISRIVTWKNISLTI
ncbi:JmjC domain, hydroxylase-domain-containing protein [Halteromyces radiatus]|uniref:JmjC domain, hydroxylase-domain-containing protein n=1 Tax=Halteromyces radiatus TaxID=101107 RepID=UPI00221E76CC|nr:JmjC domain, hydroxylase-domain-containing protein [Halteromyces radiatus]KAI8093534.1 JmjC domain, hydroxylase-domain-containing protein [Halteromyces radiatus]